MRKATKIVATLFGVSAGIAGMEHGIFEMMRGNTRSESMMIASIGPPCAPEEAWNACEPAMTILPNFLVTGILALLIGIAILVWSVGFIQRKRGGLVLMLLSAALLLFGGGLFPPLIGVIGGAAGTKINKPFSEKPAGGFLRFIARLWPWPLAIFMIWIFGQIPMGYFFNDFMQLAMYFGVFLILAMLPLSVWTAYAHDAVSGLTGGDHV